MPDLIHSLQNRDIGHLRIVAELWGLDSKARETDAALGINQRTQFTRAGGVLMAGVT